MSIIIGIDIGGSTTKIVGLREDKSIIDLLQVKANDQLTSLYGALGNFLSKNKIPLSSIAKIVATGVGSSYVNEDIYGIPTIKVNEFSAVGTGGLELSKIDNAIVVSMGTGTAFIHAQKGKECVHLGGSGVGGGTLIGLSSLLLNTTRFEQIQKLASEGDLNRIDLSVGDMSKDNIYPLPMDLTAANFGNLSDDATTPDIAMGILNMVLQVIGTIASFSCKACNTNKIILTGSLSTLEKTETVMDVFKSLNGVDIIIPEHSLYATCIGAALYSMKK